MEKVEIYDTTLRDGEQSPGCSLNEHEKVQVAKQLERLHVDVIEAGFPAASPEDFRAVRNIAKAVKNSTVTGLARSIKSDIDTAWEALKDTENPRVHVFIATSPIHMADKLKKSPEEVLKMAISAVKYARSFFPQVEFSCEYASRSEYPFMSQVIEGAIKAGASVINLPDTVGFCSPEEYAKMFHYVQEHVSGIESVRLSCHCHNDLGMAAANTLASIEAGVRQVECTVNGVGERAGNAALEEIAVALHVRKDRYQMMTQLKMNEIAKTSQMVSQFMNSPIAATKPVVGANAFSHESGIHQDGVMKNPKTYEIISPSLIGLDSGKLVLGKHSGRHAFRAKALEMGIHLSEEQINQSFHAFKDLADQKKELDDQDFRHLFSHYAQPAIH
ncbi:2-isopropylmalate synthase [Sporolactobacillus inulinus]|uniref:2-isopropylmalate synthase n=1 Tax=Sporolactobacillus inulinus TaxID=2078 RepID=UPI000255C2E8|nr:2-isopropylmalate synthase [Sporolactobacillus inulinus]GEB76714.1 hypothetical protein SIN01_10590 [Sporolactobacillus inulinus]